MKIGLTSYSLNADLSAGRKTILDAMKFAKEQGAEHFEIVPSSYCTFYDDGAHEFNEELIKSVRELSKELSLPLSNYAIGADLVSGDDNRRAAETERVKHHVEAAAKLGMHSLRHDISFMRPSASDAPNVFEALLPTAAKCTREITDYAETLGINTLVENHGFFFNGSDRMIRLFNAVDSDNFGILLDCGNFICVEEDPLVAVKKCVGIAKMVHLKDFYIRRLDGIRSTPELYAGRGPWFMSLGGEYMLRGSIVSQGDLDIPSTVETLKKSGYDGYVSIEFEGMEDCSAASAAGMSAAKYLLERA